MAKWAARVPPGSQVLDVGAGTGPYRPLFAHCDYHAQDFGKVPDAKYAELDCQSDITAIPVADQSFDAILCTEVLEHVPEPLKALREIARILRPSGRLLLTAPLGFRLHQEPYHFYSGFTPYWYHRFLPQLGFEIDSIEANRGFFSKFGLGAISFSRYIDPRRIPRDVWIWPILTLLWLVTLPLLRGVFPLLGELLDRLELERTDTVGYFVAATKKGPDTG